MAVLTAAIIMSCGGNATQQQTEPTTEAVETKPLEGPQKYTSAEIIDAYTQICSNAMLELQYVETLEDFENVMAAYADEDKFFKLTYGDSLQTVLKDPAAVDEAKEFLRVAQEFTTLVASKGRQFKSGGNVGTGLSGVAE